MDADGSNIRRLSYEQGVTNANPAWSPDGKSIAFESCSADVCDIFVMDSDGTNVRQLTKAARMGNCENPDWSPDGTTIAFELGPRASDRDGNYEIYLMNIDGANVRQLTHMAGRAEGTHKWPEGVHAWRPRWSLDGTRILFSAGAARHEELYTIKLDGSALRRLTRTTGLNRGSRHPVWSPDSRQIAFQSTRHAKSQDWYHAFEIYVMNADGSDPKRLTFNQKWDGHPDW